MSKRMVPVEFQPELFPLTWQYSSCRCPFTTKSHSVSSPWQGLLNDSLIIANDFHIHVKVTSKVGGSMHFSKCIECVFKTC